MSNREYYCNVAHKGNSQNNLFQKVVQKSSPKVHQKFTKKSAKRLMGIKRKDYTLNC